MKLHVGCGLKRLQEYVNIDIDPGCEPDRVQDAENLSHYYGAGTVDEIYACHVIEHFRYPHAILCDWAAILRPHGILRLAVPNMGEIMRAYADGGVYLERLCGLIWGGKKDAGDDHYHGWDHEQLCGLLRACGFYNVHTWLPSRIFPEDYHDYSEGTVQSEHGTVYYTSLNIMGRRVP